MHQSYKTPFSGPMISDTLNRTDVALSQVALSEALHDFISAVWAEQLDIACASRPYRIPSNFECLIMCQYACAGKSAERCISQSLKTSGEARLLQGAVTFGRLLNAERKE